LGLRASSARGWQHGHRSAQHRGPQLPLRLPLSIDAGVRSGA
jgi:hypothetical protein